MNIEISPSVALGQMYAPPSKSCAHRLLICAALADGTSVIENIGTNEDIAATVSCLRSLGADIIITEKTATVSGIKKDIILEKTELFCNESGSTLRFFIPISLLFSKETVFTGKGRLMERPQSVYERLFEKRCCFLKKQENSLICGGELTNGVFEMPGDVSSQFITGLLFALPLLEGDSEVILTSPLQSAPYIDITIDVLSKFGVVIDKTHNGFYIKGSQKYIPQKLSVEGDWSNAAFLDAFNLLGGKVELTGLNDLSFQGDKIYRQFFEELAKATPVIDITDCPDLGPVLIAVASLNKGAKLVGTKRLSIKESDRGKAMQAELSKFGINIVVNENDIVVPKCEAKKPELPLDCHNDHRIAMSLAIMCSKTGGVLKDAQCVKKSYPEFFDDIKSLGIQYKII